MLCGIAKIHALVSAVGLPARLLPKSPARRNFHSSLTLLRPIWNWKDKELFHRLLKSLETALLRELTTFGRSRHVPWPPLPYIASAVSTAANAPQRISQRHSTASLKHINHLPRFTAYIKVATRPMLPILLVSCSIVPQLNITDRCTDITRVARVYPILPLA